MTKAQKIEQEIQKLLRKVDELREEYHRVFKTYFQCGWCNKKSLLSKCDLVIDYMVTNHVYSDSVDEVERGILCPKCSVLNRCLSKDGIDRYITPFKRSGGAYYGSIKKRYQSSVSKLEPKYNFINI